MKRTLYTLILGVLALSSYADIRNGWAFWGAPINSFTFSLVDGAVTELMLPDSTVIDVDTLNVKRSTGFFFIVDGTQKEYILRLSHPDYETTYKNLTLELHFGGDYLHLVQRNAFLQSGQSAHRHIANLNGTLTLAQFKCQILVCGLVVGM